MSRRNEGERERDSLCPRQCGDATTTRTTRRSISPSFRRLYRRVWSTGERSILSTVREQAIRLNNGSVVPLSRASFHERLTKLLWNAKKYASRLAVALSLLRGNGPSFSIYSSSHFIPPLSYLVLPCVPCVFSRRFLGWSSFRNDPLKPVRITRPPISRSYFLSFSSFVHRKPPCPCFTLVSRVVNKTRPGDSCHLIITGGAGEKLIVAGRLSPPVRSPEGMIKILLEDFLQRIMAI